MHLKSYKQLEDYILKTANNYQEEIGSLLGKIKSPVIAGFLISKINRATDLGHTLILNSESQLPDSGSEDQVATLIPRGKSDRKRAGGIRAGTRWRN